jgi:hypothetical protein
MEIKYDELGTVVENIRGLVKKFGEETVRTAVKLVISSGQAERTGVMTWAGSKPPTDQITVTVARGDERIAVVFCGAPTQAEQGDGQCQS